MELKALDPELNSSYLPFALALFFPIIVFFICRQKSNKQLNLPPGPYPWPIVGNLLSLYKGHKIHVTLTDLAKSLGPLFSLRLGSRLMVVVSTQTAAREVFKFHDRELSGRSMVHISKKIPSLKTSMISISIECDERWRFLRGLSHTELFSFQALDLASQQRLQKVRDMLQYLSKKDNECVKIADIIYATLANTSTMVMASQDITSWDGVDETKELSNKLLQVGIPGIGDLYPSLVWLDFGGERKMRRYLETSNKVWGRIIKERRGRKIVGAARKQDFLDVLIQHSWDDMEICNLLTEFFLSAGTLTTSLEWAMAELTSNPKDLIKLKNELDGAAKGSILHESDLSKLPYLQACIKETLRLHPPVPFLVPRTALQACKLMNYDIPKDTIVIINTYALGRDPNTWEDPSSFKPERFLENGVDLKGTFYELLPFGSGRRICAGMNMALKEIQLLIASLVLGFDWSFVPGTDPENLDMNDTFGVTLRMDNPLKLIPKRRMALELAT